MIFKLFTPLLITLFILHIAACSPHPGAGNWKAQGSNILNISRINISFEGTADFFSSKKEDSIRRCFWSASAEKTLQLQCVHSDNTENKENYQFIIINKEQANLLQDNKLIGKFLLQAAEQTAETASK